MTTHELATPGAARLRGALWVAMVLAALVTGWLIAIAVHTRPTATPTPVRASDSDASDADGPAEGSGAGEVTGVGELSDAEAQIVANAFFERAHSTGVTRMASRSSLGDQHPFVFVPTAWADAATPGESVEAVDPSGAVVAIYVRDVGFVGADRWMDPSFDAMSWAQSTAPQADTIETIERLHGGIPEPVGFADFVDPATADYEAWLKSEEEVLEELGID